VGENMTVVSFGRAGEEPAPLLSTTPLRFSLALRYHADASRFASEAAALRSQVAVVQQPSMHRPASGPRTSRGTPHVWLAAHYPESSDFEALDLSDTDGDGITAREEYVYGTDPKAILSQPRTQAELAGTAFSLRLSPAFADRQYQLQRTLSLTQPDWQTLPSVIQRTEDAVVLTDPAMPEGGAFYRIVPTAP
jgi:hypothetical protein